jgi:uncharacterized protein HemX
MAQEPHLRAVEEPPPGGQPGTPRRAAVPAGSRSARLLAIALAVALGLLLWSRIQLGQRIDDLADQNAQLSRTVAARDAALAESARVIAGQQQKLGQVAEQLREVLALVESPLAAEHPAP